MTVRPRGLVVDNDPKVTRQIQKYLDHAFSKLSGWKVQWHDAEEPVQALELVRDEEFDFALIDFELENGETGLGIVGDLRRRRKDQCYILVLTANSNRNPDFVSLSKSAGADHAIIRTNQLTLTPPAKGEKDGWDAYSLARKIRRRMRVLDRADGFKIKFDDEAGVQAMLYSLGDPPGEHYNARAHGELIARTLIIECLEREDDGDVTLRVQHLAPGRSGAYVCKVVREEPGHPVESFVLKIGLDRAALEAEKAANGEAARVLKSQVLVRLDQDLKTDEGSGYTAIAAELVTDAVTLGDWLQRPDTTTEQAVALADDLHGNQLTRLLEENLRQPALTENWLKMSPVLRLRVNEALDAYIDIWKHEHGAHQTDAPDMAEVLRAFVESGALTGTDGSRLGEHVKYARGFGDLHASNVLVQVLGTPRPLLVDASHYGVHHWATDATRLLVNLILRVHRSGVESMLWSGVAADVEYASGLCHCGGDDAVGGGNQPVEAYIARVVEERRRYLCLDSLEPREVTWHWQWHVALAREFLRQGSQPGLLPTRAVVALAAAANHLNRAAETLRDPAK